MTAPGGPVQDSLPASRVPQSCGDPACTPGEGSEALESSWSQACGSYAGSAAWRPHRTPGHGVAFGLRVWSWRKRVVDRLTRDWGRDSVSVERGKGAVGRGH